MSSGIADLIVEVLLTIPEYAKLITPQQNQNQNQNQQQQQQQNKTQPPTNNNTNNPAAVNQSRQQQQPRTANTMNWHELRSITLRRS